MGESAGRNIWDALGSSSGGGAGAPSSSGGATRSADQNEALTMSS